MGETEAARRFVGRLLRAGVLASGALMLAGLAALAAGGDGAGVMRAGILLLILTPFARVAALAVAYARERDWLFTAVSLAVLGLLSAGALLK